MKEDGEDASRTSNGKAFHSKGARFEKEIEPERDAEIGGRNVEPLPRVAYP